MIVDSESVLVSILVPVYKVEKYIEKCAMSLFEQTYDNIEYIFVDDCSPDDSIALLESIMERYPKRKEQVKIVKHEKNMGLSNARNTALLSANGTYVMHVDSDDYVDKTIVEVLLSEALKEEADIVVCDFAYIYEDYVQNTTFFVPSSKVDYLSAILKRETTVNMAGRLIRRELIIEHAILSIPGLYHGEDYATMPRIVYFANKITKVEKPLYCYLRSDEHLRTHFVDKQGFRDLVKANQVLIDFFSSKPDVSLWPLAECKAMNKINLYCSVRYELYSEVSKLYPDLNIFDLNLSFYRKLLLYLSNIHQFQLLFYIIRVVSYLRH